MDSYKPLGIYVHIPYCKSKCQYCDFYSLGGPIQKKSAEDYIAALTKNIGEASAHAGAYEVDTVYFGGGTPSYFGDEGLRRILGELDKQFIVRRDAEITLEANPDSIKEHALERLLRSGFNRISIGIQTSNDEQLKAIGRPHSFKQAKEAFRMARSAGFENISVDLIYGLPNQTKEQWAIALQDIIQLNPEHISCYGLRVEEGTPLYDYKDCANLPDDDDQADMYLYTAETLESFGWNQYEISNFAKPGFVSRHNMKYWTGGEYIGFGPSASSDFGGKRYTYQRSIHGYVEGMFNGTALLSECESIPLRERAGEYLMLRLRTALGVEATEYSRMFRMDFGPLEKIFRVLEKHGYATKVGKRWRLTPAGFLISNQIIVTLQEAQHDAVSVWADQSTL